MTQNLVPNPGFELYGQCPSRYGELTKADGWYSGNTGTPEYFRLDCRYEQGPAHSGQGYAGLILFGDYDKAIEYLVVELDTPLRANQLYCGGFYLRAEESFMYIDRVGMLLSQEDQKKGEWVPIVRHAQITSPEGMPMVPELGWNLVEQQFVAQGGERYLTMGNFYPPEQHLIHLNEFAASFEPGWNSYYYVDDVFLYALGTGETCQSVRQKSLVKITHEEPEIAPIDTLQVRDTVWFDFDQWRLTEHAEKSLDEFWSIAEGQEWVTIYLNGHTDTVGTPGYNLYLSERRLEEVSQYFSQKGIQREQMQLNPQGENQTLILDDKPASNRLNRRVTITLRYARKRK
ncbi:OmpA family protein [bacterium SCSIO 12741]|nr:OmpA family protein [bacterium SCSIO 12741]